VLIPWWAAWPACFFAILLGFVTTKKSGTTFAMITLGIGELVASMALMFPEFFGGEGGITTDRVYGKPFFGITFGPAIQVYYLIAVYCFVCTAAMFAFTGTPLGRILNAVRDNPERVEFIGYNTQRVRYFAFIIAGFFAGIGGGWPPSTSKSSRGRQRERAALGGLPAVHLPGRATFFFGPIIGAVLLVLASVLLSELSKAWLLYLGLVFLFMVMYAPGGIASLIMMNLRLAKFGKLRALWPSYLALGGTGLVAVLGAACMVEMTYHLQLNAALGPEMNFLGATINAKALGSWFGAGLCCSRGWGCSSCAGASLCSSGGRSRKRSNTKSSAGRRCNHGG
jgi:branched-chain amino acid transport system permease protein